MAFFYFASFFLALIALGAALFSLAAGVRIYPAVKKALFMELSAAGGEPSKGGDGAILRELRRQYASKRIHAGAGRRALSGWLFLPKAQAMSVERILILAPEGRAISIEDLRILLGRGFISRASSGEGIPAVFIPKPAERRDGHLFFSFGKKEAKALRVWSRYFSVSFPLSRVLFCGKGLGAFSAIFAGARISRRTAGGRVNFAGVVADLPSFSVAAIMRRVVAKLFPRKMPCALVYAGARFASLFCGLGLKGRSLRRALKRLSSIKRKRPAVVLDVAL